MSFHTFFMLFKVHYKNTSVTRNGENYGNKASGLCLKQKTHIL